MKNQASNVVNFSNFKAVPARNQAPAEIVYMPFVVYYPVYLNLQEISSPVAVVEQPKKDNVVSMYDYLGEI